MEIQYARYMKSVKIVYSLVTTGLIRHGVMGGGKVGL